MREKLNMGKEKEERRSLKNASYQFHHGRHVLVRRGKIPETQVLVGMIELHNIHPYKTRKYLPR